MLGRERMAKDYVKWKQVSWLGYETNPFFASLPWVGVLASVYLTVQCMVITLE